MASLKKSKILKKVIREAFKKIEKSFGNEKNEKSDRKSIWDFEKKLLEMKNEKSDRKSIWEIWKWKKWLETTQEI